jgi:DNA-damage-inducible protein D
MSVINKNLEEDVEQSAFEKIKHINEFDNEYWSARELSSLLEYSEFSKFKKVLEKAIESCKNSGYNDLDHIAQVGEMVGIGSGAKRNITDYHLSRYACYLIVQNADPTKEVVAKGQTYFAMQTRKQEISEMEEYQKLKTQDEKRLFLRNELKKHNLQLATAAKNVGVIEPIDYAIFQDHGYKGLYGGLGQKDIHKKKGLKPSQKILDHMGTTELAANLFRATQAEEKLKTDKDKIKSKKQANEIHYEIGKKVRKAIKDIGGTMPEELPAEESIKKIETKMKKLNQSKK